MKIILGAELKKIWSLIVNNLDKSDTIVKVVSDGVFDIYKKENIKVATFKFNEKLIEYLRKKNVEINDFYSIINTLLNEDTAQNKVNITMTNNIENFFSNVVKVKNGETITFVPVVFISFKAITAKKNYKKVIMSKIKS